MTPTHLRVVREQEEEKSKKDFEHQVQEILTALSKKEMTLNQMCRTFHHSLPKIAEILEHIQKMPEYELMHVRGNMYGRTTYILRNKADKTPLIRKATVDLLVRMLREEPLSFEELKFQLASPPFFILQLIRVARLNYGHTIVDRNGMFHLDEGRFEGFMEAEEITGSHRL